jgi:glycine/D-amino acid oxidase-like deaminating enzyme
MADPLAVTIAASVASKIADTAVDGAQQAVTAITRKIREKLHSRPDRSRDVATLDATITSGDQTATQALARLLEQLFAADPHFREEVRALWDHARPDNSVTSIFNGKADKVIMMRDVNGDLTVN